MSDGAVKNHAAFIWSVADKLRGVYKQSEYGRVILPLVVLRRLDCVLEPTKDAVLERAAALKGRVDNVDPVLSGVTGHRGIWNTSKLDFKRLLDDPTHAAGNLRAYIAGFSPSARDVIDAFGFETQITRLDEANLLYLVLGQFAEIDLHPETVSNTEMGYLYEELIRRFSELSNETAGEHFTPREVIRLMVDLLFVEDEDTLRSRGIVKTLYDPACGTGGMLSVAEDYLRELNPDARLEVFGQELNAETYAICRSDMMLKGQDASHIARGNSFSEDGHAGRTFDYMLANPPFGVEWKQVEKDVRDEHETRGFGGRFGAGLPRINDGSFLFLQHMLSKMKPPEQGGSRVAIVFNGSPLFTGAAGSGESEIRRWIIENDWLEAVVALPDQLFYNTGISTYFWVVTNRKRPERRGKVQLVDARASWVKMRKSLGEKRKQLSDEQIRELVELYGAFDGGRAREDLPQRAVRLPADHRRAAAAAALHRRRPRERLEDRVEQSKLDDAEADGRRRSDARPVGLRRTRPRGEHVRSRRRAHAAASPRRSGRRCSRRSRYATRRRRSCTAKGGSPEPDPELRDAGERAAAAPRRARRLRARPDRAARERALPPRRRRVRRGRGAPLRPRRLGRPSEDEARLRDPAHPALLPLRPAAAARGDRRRDPAARGGDSGAARAR